LQDNRSLEEVLCVLCGSGDSEHYQRVWDRFDPARERRWSIVRCRGCGLLYLNPRPSATQLARHYESEEYDPFQGTRTDRSLWDRFYAASRSFALSWKRRTIEAYVEGGRILDIGCGTGEFLRYMQAAGWQVAGLEPDPRAARFAQERLRLPVTNAGVDELARMTGEWDVITFWHVLEHLPNPLDALKAAARLLAPARMILVAIPNPDSLDAGVYGYRWVAWDCPRHLVYFTSQTLSAAAEQIGLEIVACKAMPLDAPYNCLMSERCDPRAVPGLKWLRALFIGLASWGWGQWPRNASRGSSVLYLLRRKS
jgi:2-polyprenyl-3-methyl-5-hydroxy-6-metoxy-1,4-benzoquinol methylase